MRSKNRAADLMANAAMNFEGGIRMCTVTNQGRCAIAHWEIDDEHYIAPMHDDSPNFVFNLCEHADLVTVDGAYRGPGEVASAFCVYECTIGSVPGLVHVIGLFRPDHPDSFVAEVGALVKAPRFCKEHLA